MESSLARLAKLALRHPALSIISLAAIVLAIELLQYQPEWIFGAHATGEVIRNLAYALIGALVFHWLVVQIPANQLRRKTYEFHKQQFEVLLTSTLGLLKSYELGAIALKDAKVPEAADLDVWDRESLEAFGPLAQVYIPGFYDTARVGLLNVVVDIAVPRALKGLSVAVPYLDAEVAHALSLYPLQDGMNPLQVNANADGSIAPSQDLHIVWTLLEAARELYPSLISTGAYGRDLIRGEMKSTAGQTHALADDAILR